MIKILLTGASGFIGSNILKELSINNKIYVIVRNKKIKLKSKNIFQINFKTHEQLNKKLKKIKVDIIIHCATHYIKHHEIDDIQKLCDSNILFGNIILENLKNMNVKKFLNFSTVWTDYNGEKDNFYNLYSAYKKAFINIINYYKKKEPGVNFYNLVISDTFGNNDQRNKLINTLKKNYKLNKTTNIVSKNLYLNLLNVEDIVLAIKIIIKKNLKSRNFILRNRKNFRIFDIVSKLNKSSARQLKINWLSNKKIYFKSLKYSKLNNWFINKSNINDIIELIKSQN